MGRMTKVHIVNHTHWDREWYFTAADSLVLSDELFSDILDELREQPEATFVLDGQLSILDEYVSIHPERFADIQELVQTGKLLIGPWYTQTDAFFTSGESILRNGMIGIYESRKYGPYMSIGYLPDTFGFNAQIPVILKALGLDSVIFWRGINLGKQVQSPYFRWKGLGGNQELIAINLPQGYGTGMLLEASDEYVSGRLDPAVDFIKQFTEDEEILIPSGNDQLGITIDFREKIAKINELGKYTYEASTYQRFLTTLQNRELEVYQGEFREPVLARIHKTIGSVRMDIKQLVYSVEQKLLKQTEPLLVIAQQMGIKLSHDLLRMAWKKLLACQAHDSLAGCVSDSVATDILHRLKEADEICDGITNIVGKRIAEALNLAPNDILIFNTCPQTFKGTKEITLLSPFATIAFEEAEMVLLKTEYIPAREQILEETPSGNHYITEPGYYRLTVELTCELPGLGYKVFSFKESCDSQHLCVTADETSIGNQDFQIVYGNQSISLQRNGHHISDFLSLYDEGNAGDTYDFSPMLEGKIYSLPFTNCQITKGSSRTVMTLTGRSQLPRDLTERRENVASVPCDYSLELYLAPDNSIHGKLQISNTILNHRMRIGIKGAVGEINSAVASLPFGYIERQNNQPENWVGHYAEQPVPIEPFEETVTVIGKTGNLTFLGKGLKEYQYQEDELLVTLFASTDSLGKPDLLYRPGRASGDITKKGHVSIPTPMAQLEDKKLSFEFVISLKENDFSEDITTAWRNQELSPNVTYQLQELNYFAYRIDNKIQKRREKLMLKQREVSIISLPSEYFVSSCSPAYYHPGAFVVRIENPTGQRKALDILELSDSYEMIMIDALEQEQPPVDSIDPYSILSFLAIRKHGGIYEK